MQSRRNRRSFAKLQLLGTSMLGISAPVFAKDAAPPEDEISTIIVTARRTEERLQDVPISITVFNQEQIANRNIINAGDLATYTPSLTTNSRFGTENTTFAIRGFTQDTGTSPSVAVYFADVVAPRVNGFTTGGNGAGPGSFFDLQNVQILKGPQGTLFGRNTTGGAVLIVPQKPTYKTEGYVEASAGNYDMRRFQGVVNVPITDNLRFRLGGDMQKRDGYLNNISPLGPRDFGDVDYWAVRGSVVWNITPNLENYTILSISNTDTNGFYPKVYTTFGQAAPRSTAAVNAQLALTRGRDFYDVANGEPNPYMKTDQRGAINTTTWATSDNITFKNIISYQEFESRQSANIFGDFNISNAAPLTIFNMAADIHPKPGFKTAAQSTFTEELQLQGSALDSRLTYQIGGYWEKSKPLSTQGSISDTFLDCTDLFNYQCADIQGRSIGREGLIGSILEGYTRYKFEDLGVYAQSTFKITDQWSVTGGIRYTDDKSEGVGQALKANFRTPNVPTWACQVPSPLTVGGTSAQIRANPALCTFAREVESKKPTWLLDIDYKPIDDILLYAKYARGYRQGSVAVASYGLETWQPEKVDVYEVGTKTSFGGPVPGTFNLSAFYNDFTDQQLQIIGIGCTAISQPQCPFTTQANSGVGNAGKSTISGIEVEAAIRPLRDFRVDVNYAYLDTKLKSVTKPPIPIGFTDVQSRAIVGGPLPLTPRNKYSATGTYTLPLDESVGKIALSATYTHQDETFSSISSPGKLPSQKNLNLNASWNSILGSPLDLSLFATNVTQEETYLNYVGGSSFGFDAAILNQPRMYGARLRYKFGAK
jgi:iron complex outermembrane receptor protein